MFKKIIILLSLLVSVGLFCFADANTKQMESNPQPGGLYLSGALPVEGGSYSFTNDYTHPWSIASIWVTFPATVTNTFTIDLARYTRTITDGDDVVTTNEFGNAETNAYHEQTITTVATTNRMFSDSTTNIQSIAYTHESDLPRDYYTVKNDIITFTLTRTNLTYLYFNGIR